LRIAIKWGVIFALSVILWTAVVHLLGIYTVRIEYADLVDRAAIVLPVVAITLALLEQRRTLNGTLPFGRGVLTGVAVAAVSAPFTVAALWYYHHYVNPQWLSILVTYEKQKLTSAGLPADQIAARMAQLQQAGADKQQILGGLIGTVAFGIFLSLIITAVLGVVGKMRRPAPQS
jgi:hypothetical protein